MEKVIPVVESSTWWFSVVTQLFSVVFLVFILYYLVKLYKKIVHYLERK